MSWAKLKFFSCTFGPSSRILSTDALIRDRFSNFLKSQQGTESFGFIPL